MNSFQWEEIAELSNGKESQMSKESKIISSSSNEYSSDQAHKSPKVI